MKLSRIIGVTCFLLLFVPLLFVQAQEPRKTTVTQVMNRLRKDSLSADLETRRRAMEGFLEFSQNISHTASNLRAGLADPDDEIRAKAAKALIGFGAKGDLAVDGLVYALEKDKYAEVRVHAASALGAILWQGNNPSHAKTVVPALVKAMRRDKDTLVRRSACYAFRMIGELAKDAARDLLDVMKDKDDPSMRELASLSFDEVVTPDSKAVVPILLEILKSGTDDVNVERSVLRALGVIDHKDESAVLPLINVLKKSNRFESRSWAVFALGKIGPKAKSAIPDLVRALEIDRDVKPHVRVALQKTVLTAIGEMGPEARSAIPTIRAMVDDDRTDKQVRAVAIAVLKILDK